MPAVQLCFPEFEPPTPLDNVFFAVRLAPEAFSQIEQIRSELRHEHGLKGAVISPQRLHVTLLHVCECDGLPDELIEAACRAAASVGDAAVRCRFRSGHEFPQSAKQEAAGSADLRGQHRAGWIAQESLRGDERGRNRPPHVIAVRAAHDAAIRPANGGRASRRAGAPDRARFRACAQPRSPKPAYRVGTLAAATLVSRDYRRALPCPSPSTASRTATR